MKALIFAATFLTAMSASARAGLSDFSDVLHSDALNAAVGEGAKSVSVQNGEGSQFLVNAQYEDSSCVFGVSKVGGEFSVQALGCAVESDVRLDSATAPTFTQDIKPIFKARCSVCHGPGKMRPEDFTDYNTVIKNKDAIVARVLTKKDMPMGSKLDQPSLDLISAWVKAGAPQ